MSKIWSIKNSKCLNLLKRKNLINIRYKTDNSVNSEITRSHESSTRAETAEIEPKGIQLPDPPSNCCMAGCANCVWIDYAEELTKIFRDGGEKAQKVILEKVTDPNIKAFLLSEFRIKFIK